MTGTNGKTTTALARQVLEAAGIRTGLLGTVHSVIGGRVEEVERTTPEAVDLQATFARMLEAGDRACVMEVSHALDLNRTAGIEFACAVFTNLTQDHLDFHGTMDDYYAAKQKLFLPADGSRPAAAVVNVDDEWGRKLASELTASRPRRAREVRSRARGRLPRPRRALRLGRIVVRVLDRGWRRRVRIPLPGLFNVYNSIAAIAAGGALGVPLDVAAAALRNATRVPGRFEPIEEGQGFGVLVDYAHTPDSLENVLVSARELLDQAGGEGRLIVVFGAGGDRDREKRPLMGAAAQRLADHTLVTSDNPRSEEPEAIIAAIVSGAEKCPAGRGLALEVEGDRRAAIERAMEMAQPGDIVLIAGKGHEQGQEFESGRKVPFDDRDVAREALRGLAAGSHASAPVIGLSPTEIARAAGATLVAGAPEPDGAADAPTRPSWTLARSAQATCSGASRASARTAGRLPRPQSRPAHGARS